MIKLSILAFRLSIISTLRDFKDDQVSSNLYALALMGTESIKEALAVCRDPRIFSAQTTLPTSCFTQSEVKDLFN